MNLNPFRDLGAQQGDGLVMAFELVLTTTIMGALGFWLDRTVGTIPLFTVFFAAFTLAYEVWKIVGTYDAEMAAHAEARRPLRQGPVR